MEPLKPTEPMAPMKPMEPMQKTAARWPKERWARTLDASVPAMITENCATREVSTVSVLAADRRRAVSSSRHTKVAICAAIIPEAGSCPMSSTGFNAAG